LSYEAFLTRTGGVKQRRWMSRWIAESSLAAGLIAKVLAAIRDNGNLKGSAIVELFFFVVEFRLSLLPFRLSKRANQ
jgi:hypothetical protein